MHKIVLILPYFGKFHNYFNFWVESVKNNPSIDWILYTDNEVIIDHPKNLIIKNISFENFSKILKNYFTFDAVLDTPYKLCDYKILYGEALIEDVKNYNFWGFCDCDLIWGDIRKFITDDMLGQYDHLFGLGPFQLQKVGDEKYVNVLNKTLALGKYNLKEVYSDNRNYVIDELPCGMPLTYYNNYPKSYFNEFSVDKRPYDAPNPNYLHFIDGYNSIIELKEDYKKTMYYTYREQVEFWNGRDTFKRPKQENIIYKYISGKLYKVFVENSKVKEEEIMYVHFTKRSFKVQTKNVLKFIVVPNRFIDFKEEISTKFLKRYGGRKPLKAYFLNLWNKINRKLKMN